MQSTATTTKMQGGFYKLEKGRKKVLLLAGMIKIRRKRKWGETIERLTDIIQHLKSTRSIGPSERCIIMN